MDIKREDLICKDCMSPSTSGFKKIISLKNSGLLIYLHIGEEENKKHNTLNKKEKNAAGKSKSLKIFILHNDSGHDLRRPDYAIEMCQPRTRCFRCINLIKRVRSLLDELNFIGKNQIIGLCEHCKRNPGACKRCQYIVSKFLENKTELHKDKQDQFKSWLDKLNQILHHVLNDENVDRGQINSDPSALELARLLQELKQPLRLQNLNTAFLPTDMAQLSSITAGNEMIDDLLTKIKTGDWGKPGLEEDLPPVDKSIQLQSKEHEKVRPRQLPPLSIALQKKRFQEWVEKDKASIKKLTEKSNIITEPDKINEKAKKEKIKVLSGMTTTSNLRQKENVPENQSKNITVTESPRQKNTNKEKNETISEKSTKSSTSRLPEKGNASKDKSEDKASKYAELYGNEMIEKERNKLISMTAAKDDKIYSRNQSKNKLDSTTESPKKKEINKDEPQSTSSKSTKGSKKILKEGDSNENQNSKAKEKKISGVLSKVSHKSELKDSNKNKQSVSLGKDVDILTLIKIYGKGKNHGKDAQNTTNPFANVELPSLAALAVEAAAGQDEDLLSLRSILGSDQNGPDVITDMIKSTKIVDYDPHYKDDLLNISETENNILPNLFEDTVKQKQHSSDGVLRYKLSNKTFIDKGYTILPLIEVMKRINVYKMEPVNPHLNWFQRHKDDRTKNYDTGEILAEIKENGTGKWFYKNGRIALDCYKAEETLAGQRYVLYSSGEEIKDQGARLKELKNKPQVLGVFDQLGNGAVYDIHGNERLKYNQTEGLVLDSKIGPASHWKWHSLNDPPILEPVIKDNYAHPLCLRNLRMEDHKEHLDKKHQNPEVLKAELKIFAKRQADKLLQKFKPHQIRMKAFKINDEISLRIIDQANIYLLFRHGTMSMKLNLGLQLVSNEIVETDAAEVGAVATPYDRIPPRTTSVADIQYNLEYTRKLSQRKAKTSNSLSISSSKPNTSSKNSILQV